MQAYADFMAAFSQRYRHLLGSTITDAEVGLGPQGELRYPSTPSDRRWSFPGIGEFQCYDRFMLASLQAAAQHVGQPHWGLGGPHDAGTYTQWPHQTGFFHPRGSWASEYGSFFLQWYSSLLTRHAERVLASASAALGRHGVQLHARLPVLHWWYNQAAHAVSTLPTPPPPALCVLARPQQQAAHAMAAAALGALSPLPACARRLPTLLRGRPEVAGRRP